MPGLNRNEKITCRNCGTPTTKLNIVRHKTRCSAGTLYCTQCSNFATKSQSDLIYRIAKKHSASKLSLTYKCKLCHAKFPGFYALRQHKKTSTRPTNWIRSEQFWCGGYSERRWRSKFERRIGILQTLFDRYWNGEWKTQSSFLSCHPSTYLCSTIN